jgi:hypothetical protein
MPKTIVFNVIFDYHTPNLVGQLRVNEINGKGINKCIVGFCRRLADGDWITKWHAGTPTSRRRAMRVAPQAQANINTNPETSE